MSERDYSGVLLDLAANQHVEERAINETSEMLEGIEAIVLSIADRVDRIQSMIETLIDGMLVIEKVNDDQDDRYLERKEA